MSLLVESGGIFLPPIVQIALGVSIGQKVTKSEFGFEM
jgi:hypothetical protein